jgi:hypothetical protein
MNDQHDENPDPTDRRGAPDPEQLLTALSTEHFTLQGARSQTMSESSARASVYVFAVSSALVALGFIGQLSDVGDVFNAFALTVLPTLYLLGIVTFVRLVECGAEDFRYGLAINRIRHYYEEVAGDRANLFLLSGHDDGEGVFANMGLPAEGRKPYFAFSSAILVIKQRGRRDRGRRGGWCLPRRAACSRRRRGHRGGNRLGRRMAPIRGSPARRQRCSDRAPVPVATAKRR